MIARLAAPALSLALVGYCGVLGYAALALSQRPRPTGQNLLLAPIVGFAVILLPTFWLSWLGLAVERFAVPLAIVLGALACVVLWLRRPVFPVRLALLSALPLTVALVLSGWPLATLGFSWLAYANDDMANYCLLAERLLHHGLVDAPSLTDLARNTDLSLSYWYLESRIARPGSQLILAWLGAIVPRPLPELFMPLLLALHLALVASTGALVYRRPFYRSAALVTCWLLAASPLTTLGTMSQLIAQVFGLALGAALVAVAWDTLEAARPRPGCAALLGAVGAAFLLVYPEAAPFAAVAILWRIADVAYRTRRVTHLRALAVAGAVGLVLVAPYADRMVGFVIGQARFGSGSATTVIFPYYLVPAGFATFWGLVPLAQLVPEPWLSASIAVGALLVAIASVWTLGVLRRGEATAVVLLGMLISVPVLFARQSGFGLFKLAMYAQPFLLGTLALSPLRTRRLARAAPFTRRRGFARWHALFLLLLALAGLPAQRAYVRSAVHGGMTFEMGDHKELIGDLNEVRQRRATSLEADLPDITLAKLFGLYVRGAAMRLINIDLGVKPPDPVGAKEVNGAEAPRFAMLDPARPDLDNEYYKVSNSAPDRRHGHASDGEPARCENLVTETASQTLLNRFRPIDDAGNALRTLRCDTATNHLAFVSSKLGRHYYLDFGRDGPSGRIGLFGLEPDYFFPKQSMAGLGRYLLFEVINPSPRVRVLLEVSATLKADGHNMLPPADVIGSQRVAVGLVGRGSTRTFSPPLEPQVINGRSYIALDLGAEGTRYPNHRAGLMTLFGQEILLDPRQIVVLGRNISAVSEDEYSALRPPDRVAEFPAGLTDPSVEYSGLYEDGWVSETARLRLTRPAEATRLVIRGQAHGAPDAQHPMKADVELGHETIASQMLTPGAFEISAPIGGGTTGVVEIALRFSNTRPLDGGGRPAAAHLGFIGFQ